MKRKGKSLFWGFLCILAALAGCSDMMSDQKMKKYFTLDSITMTSSSITVNWTDSSGDLGKMKVSCGGSLEAAAGQGAGTVSVDGLSAGTEYSVLLKGYNRSGDEWETRRLRISATDTGTKRYIYSAKGLYAVRDDLAGDYILMNDIDLSDYSSGEGWEPIGDSTTAFTGIFDGRAHKISGLAINRSGQYQGLFGCVGSGGIITDIKVECEKVSGTDDVGALAGESSGTISNSCAEGEISGANGVGGLVGYNNSGAIENSYSSCKVSGSSYYIGGLVGNNGGTISNSFATGAVSGTVTVGGLVGENNGTISNSYATDAVNGKAKVGGLVGLNNETISNSYATGAVSGDLHIVGGLVGENYGTISNSYATGAVNGTGTVGGLVGEHDGTISNSYATGAVSGGYAFVGGLVGEYYGPIENSYYDSETTGQSDTIKGTPYTTAQMKLQDAGVVYDTDIYVDWDFAWESDNGTEEIWSIGALNSGYPYLTDNAPPE